MERKFHFLENGRLSQLTPWNRYPYNYHVYQVKTAFEVSSGPIAPWFGQAGQGVQYQLSTNIMGLIDGGFLERVSLQDENHCGS